ALILTRHEDVQYATGFQAPGWGIPVGCVIMPGLRPLLVLPESILGLTEDITSGVAVRGFPSPGPVAWTLHRPAAFWQRVLELLQEHRVDAKTIGIQLDHVSVNEYQMVRSTLQRASLKNCSQLLYELRQVKDSTEIAAIRNSVKIAEIGLRTALETVSPGRSNVEVSAEVESAMRTAGRQLTGLRATVMSCVDDLWREEPSYRVIRPDDMLVVEVTTRRAGYYAQMSRTLRMGELKEKQSRLFRTAMAALETIENMLVPENEVRDAANSVRRLLDSIDGVAISGRLGSSIGLCVSEPPVISPDERTPVREGMVFSVGPVVRGPDREIARVGELVLVTSDGAESLSTLLRETM
ncbi:MAG: Xaa-Pro peptidase family protein, partial [Candidatus Thorarchaeota archaeon]